MSFHAIQKLLRLAAKHPGKPHKVLGLRFVDAFLPLLILLNCTHRNIRQLGKFFLAEALFCAIFLISYLWVTTKWAGFAMLDAVKDDPRFIRREAFTLRVIKERFLYRLIGAILCAVAAIFFVCVAAWHAAILFAAGAVALTIFAFRSSASYQAARLICENPILSVGIASVAEAGAREAAEVSVNVVVSGFGILMDGKPYHFGHGGIDLKAVRIDRESISLSFGGEEKAYSVRLLHGIGDKAEVEKLTERLRYETGVVADVSGW